MHLFLLLSAPLLLVQLAHNYSFESLIAHRARLFHGFLWGILAGLLLFLLVLGIKPRIAPVSLYFYGFFLHFFIPVLLALIPLLPQCLRSQKRGLVESMFFELHLCGFFISFSMAIYIVHYGDLDQFLLFYLPLFYVLCIPILAKGLWRSRRFEAHWNVLSGFLLLLILFALPLTEVLHKILRPWLGWAVGGALLILMLLFSKFLNHLEQGIRFRLNLETKFSPFIRLFSRLSSRR